jgi:membrane protease YdiL (CAAX protease family)
VSAEPMTRTPSNAAELRAGWAGRDLIELAVAYGLIIATIWTPNPAQRILYWLAFLFIVATSWVRHEGWNALGLSIRGFFLSLWIVGAAVFLSVAAVVVAAHIRTLHPLHGPSALGVHVWGYLVWALMQQFILQSYFLIRLMRLIPEKIPAVIVAAVIFSLAHLPNPVLTPVTLVWGLISCMLFLRYRSIYSLGIAHGILGLCVAITVPNHLQHHMRVGLGYLRYHPRYHDQRSHSDHSVSTEAWVMAEAPTLRSARHARP